MIFQIRKEMLTGLGKAQDRLEFLQGKAVSGDDDDMVIVSNMKICISISSKSHLKP